jgi:hypothetical protein
MNKLLIIIIKKLLNLNYKYFIKIIIKKVKYLIKKLKF